MVRDQVGSHSCFLVSWCESTSLPALFQGCHKPEDGKYRQRKPKHTKKGGDYKTKSYYINSTHQNSKFSYNEMQIKLNRGFNNFTTDENC